MSASNKTISDTDVRKAKKYIRDRGFGDDAMSEYGLEPYWDEYDECLRLRIPFLNGDGPANASGAYATGRFLGTGDELEEHDLKMRTQREAEQDDKPVPLLGRREVNGVPKYRNDRGEKPPIFGTPDTWDAPRVAITESIFDALALDYVGIPAFAMAGAANIPDEDIVNLLRARREITIVTQRDRASKQWATKVTAALSGVLARLYIVEIPDGDDFKDVAEFLELYDPKSLEKYVRQQKKPLSNPNRRLMAIADIDDDDESDTGPMWGTDEQRLWADGQSMILLAHIGIGKTTLALNLALSSVRQYLDEDNPQATPEVLGFPMVEVERVLYIAADRWDQVKDRIRTMTSGDERRRLKRHFLLHKGPPEINIAKHPEKFVEWVHSLEPGIVIIDSVKDVALDLASDSSGSAFNRAVQLLVTDGVNLLIISHPRKGSSDQRANRPLTLDDVYGSMQIAAGAGSVLVLEGDPREARRRLRTVKEVTGDGFEFNLEMDKVTGLMSRDDRIHVPHPDVLYAFIELEKEGYDEDDDEGSSVNEVMGQLDIEDTGRARKTVQDKVFKLQDEGWLSKTRDKVSHPRKGNLPALWQPSSRAKEKKNRALIRKLAREADADE